MTTETSDEGRQLIDDAVRKGRKIVLAVDGHRYELSEINTRPLDVFFLREKTKLSMRQLFDQAENACDLDTVAIVIWMVKRATDPTVTFEEVATSFGYDSDFKFLDANDEEIKPPE